jgi:hypothetical protein
MDPRNSTLVPPSTPLTCSRPSRTSAIATASVKRVACASVLSLEAARELGRVRSRRPTCAPAGQAHAFFALARAATSLRDSRATVDGGSERFQAVGEAGLRPASLCLILHRCWRFRLSGGGGIRTPEGPNGPLRFSRPQAFRSAMRPEALCATQRATVRFQRTSSRHGPNTCPRACGPQSADRPRAPTRFVQKWTNLR